MGYSPEGGTPKFFYGGVRLRFSIGYPWLRKFWSKTYPWLRTICWFWAHSYVILKNFSSNISFGKINLAKIDDNLVPKRQFLVIFWKNIPLAKEFLRNPGSLPLPTPHPTPPHHLTTPPPPRIQQGRPYYESWNTMNHEASFKQVCSTD